MAAGAQRLEWRVRMGHAVQHSEWHRDELVGEPEVDRRSITTTAGTFSTARVPNGLVRRRE
jgi:hypothetical protein